MTERCGGVPTNWKNHSGMTLRDYFAAESLKGFNTKENRTSMKKKHGANADQIDTLIAKASYLMADAMLKERNK
ncbi:MAG: hypothetical protein KAT14_07825 [Candidatus Marinimicrobia bacterium]|nr:hypothetical protein [Candidatus Neomarinimicrobiota bacterium]